jgi:hypothetical protein
MSTKKLPRVTMAQALLLLMGANLMGMGFLISLTNYNHDIAKESQKNIIKLLDSQGNLSATQRQKIIGIFENLPVSGLSGNAQSDANLHLLMQINASLTKLTETLR